MNKAGYFSRALIILIFACIVVFWFYRVTLLPGLHGDEAWFGLKAIEFLETGVDKPYGIRKYTGILQSLFTSIVFKYGGIGIYQLRLTGLLFNVISLAILTLYFIRKVNPESTVLLLLFFFQSALYMIYPKIAWEVNSFNLFFVVLFLVSAIELSEKADSPGFLWTFIFLGSGLLGSYNHFIFSCLPMSAFIGTVICTIYNKNDKYFSFTVLLLVNCANIILLYLLSQHAIDTAWGLLGGWLFVAVILLVLAESIYAGRIRRRLVPALEKMINLIQLSRLSVIHILVMALILFAMVHGILFWQVVTQDVVFLRVYSHELPFLEMLILGITGGIILLFILVFLAKDIRKYPQQPWPFIIISYLGLITAYTTGSTIRYHLTLFAIIFIYLSYRMGQDVVSKKLKRVLVLSLLISAMLVQSILWSLSNNDQRKIMAHHFPLGNWRTETSAHFLPFEPVISFLEKTGSGKLVTSEKYFIGNDFEFYKLIKPGIKNLPGIARIEYDYETYGDGFRKEVVNTH